MSLEPRKDEDAKPIDETEFKKRFKFRFLDPIYDEQRTQISALADLAWKAHEDHHKAPFTKKAGPGFANPDYDLSVFWSQAKTALQEAQTKHEDKSLPINVLLISASDRNDQSCPGEISKTRRLTKIAKEIFDEQGAEVEVLDLSLITSEYGKNIHPCKGCVSTAMPLCHWPCSCYPNFASDQMHDWMNEIYPMFVRAHAVMIVTPVYWLQAPSALKLLMDRMVCADGGNADPTSTEGKNAKLAKKIEIKGWDYPKHLRGRVYANFVHGDAEGVDNLRTALDIWLANMHFIPASFNPTTARYVGYYEPYATSHDALDKDKALQDEMRHSARVLLATTKAARAGSLASLDPKLDEPRPK